MSEWPILVTESLGRSKASKDEGGFTGNLKAKLKRYIGRICDQRDVSLTSLRGQRQNTPQNTEERFNN